MVAATNQVVQQWIRPALSKLRGLFDLDNRAESILEGLVRLESSVNVSDSAIAIGFGACTDLVVDSLEIFGKFAAPTNPKPVKNITSWQNLLELFGYYFSFGAASEYVFILCFLSVNFGIFQTIYSVEGSL